MTNTTQTQPRETGESSDEPRPCTETLQKIIAELLLKNELLRTELIVFTRLPNDTAFDR